MQSHAQIVHQTRDRLRLRIPERRRDISFFVDLYEDLRQIPGVTDVVINPGTASVLLHFQSASNETVLSSLRRIGLLPGEKTEQPSQPVLAHMERFFPSRDHSPTHLRAVLLLIMIGIAIHQIRRGKIFGATLSVLWYAYDLVAAHKREKVLLGRDSS
jgi:hypothetical protein